MVKENVNIVEKAKRLVELCRECSRDNNRKAPVWLSHVRSGCGLESEYPPPTDRGIKQRGGEYKLVYPSHDVFVERFYFIEDGDIVASVHECLECYSELIVRETEYDDMEVWHRGLSLLAEYCANKREIYWLVELEDKPPFPKHFLFESLELLKRQKEDGFYAKHEFVRDCEDSGTSVFDLSRIPRQVYNAWIENPDNRWVIRWKNMFRDIEMAAQSLLDTWQFVTSESAKPLDNCVSFTLTEKERRVYSVLFKADNEDLLSVSEIMSRTQKEPKVKDGPEDIELESRKKIDIVGKDMVNQLIEKLIENCPPFAVRPKPKYGVRLTLEGRNYWKTRERDY